MQAAGAGSPSSNQKSSPRGAAPAHIRAWHPGLTAFRQSSRQHLCFWGRPLPRLLLGRPCWHQASGTSTCSARGDTVTCHALLRVSMSLPAGNDQPGGQAAALQHTQQSRQGWAQAGQHCRLCTAQVQVLGAGCTDVMKQHAGVHLCAVRPLKPELDVPSIRSEPTGCTDGGFCS